MACTRPDVPTYLHWDGILKCPDCDFLDEHLLYRLYFSPNPIEFPAGQTNAFSCKWSNYLINLDHIFLVDDPPLGDKYESARIHDLRLHQNLGIKNDGGTHLGLHKLTCFFNHDPLECDISHSEILIKHQIFTDNTESHEIFSTIYTYTEWNNGNAILNHPKNQFYKQLRKNYRTDIIKYFL